MSDPGRPLSRNRHFHTFESPEGRAALKIFKRLVALKRDMRACEQSGGLCRVEQLKREGKVKVEITLERLRSRRTVTLEAAELELLEAL